MYDVGGGSVWRYPTTPVLRGRLSLCATAVLLLLCVSVVRADPESIPATVTSPGDLIQQALDQGDLEAAEALVKQVPDQDRWLGKIALAQVSNGDVSSAKQTLRRIHSPSELTRAATAVANQAQGGATGADFDSLINLITNTVEPNSWDEVGGPGTIVSFPGGVAVNTQGVLTLQSEEHTKPSLESSLDALRVRNQHHHQTGDVRRPSKLRMVSLPRLERELMIRLAMGEKPTEAMTHLAGLFEIQYVFVYPETNDVVVAGPAAGWAVDDQGRAVTREGRPVLLLDDFVSVLRNAREHQGRFGCSIDPKRANLAATQAFLARPTGPLKPSRTKRWVHQIRDTLGLQDIRVYGLPASSHAARVIVEADYHMKLVGMGLEPTVDGLESYLDSIDKQSIPKSMDVLRWWFTMRPHAIEQNADETAFALTEEVVQLQCDNERLEGDGVRRTTQMPSALNQQFAHQFTQQFHQLRREYPIYAQLDQLFRMALVAGILERTEVPAPAEQSPETQPTQDVSLWQALRPARGSSPSEVPSIVNHRVIDRRHVIVGVSGGVTVDIANTLNGIKTNDDAQLASKRSSSSRKPSVQSSDAWWWD